VRVVRLRPTPLSWRYGRLHRSDRNLALVYVSPTRFACLFRAGPCQRPVVKSGAPYGNRTRVSALRGRRPRPLDEGSAVPTTMADVIIRVDTSLSRSYQPSKLHRSRSLAPSIAFPGTTSAPMRSRCCIVCGGPVFVRVWWAAVCAISCLGASPKTSTS